MEIDTPPTSRKRSYTTFKIDELPLAVAHPRRTDGMFLTTIYNSLTTSAVRFLATFWAYLTGAPEAPQQIIAVGTDSSGKKRRAVEGTRPKATIPKRSSRKRMPGSFPDTDHKMERPAAATPPDSTSPPHQAANVTTESSSNSDSKTEAQVQLNTPPDSRPGSSQSNPTTHTAATADQSAHAGTTSNAGQEKPAYVPRPEDDYDRKPRDGRRPVNVILMDRNAQPKPAPAEAATTMSTTNTTTTSSLANKNWYKSHTARVEASLLSIRGPKRRSKLPADAIPPLEEQRKPNRRFSPTQDRDLQKQAQQSTSQQIPDQTQGEPSSSSQEGRTFSASQSQNQIQTLKESTPSIAPSVQRNAQRDAKVDALVKKAKNAVAESPEDKAAKKIWRVRKAEAVAKQKAVEEAEWKRINEENAEAQRKMQEPLSDEEKEQQQKEFEEEMKKIEAFDSLSFDDHSSFINPASDPDYLKKQQLVRPLDQEWEDKVTKAMETKSRQHIITKTVDGTDLTRHDFGSLVPQHGSGDDPAGWLNDEIVNAWMATIVQSKLEKDGYVKSPNNVPSYVAFTSAWYLTYKSKKSITGIQTWSRRKGIKGEKLLQAEKIFFPVNTGAHWMLLVISPKKRKIEFLDSLNQGSVNDKFYAIARDWLKMELGDKYKAEEWKDVQTMSSWQQNSNDCGVFACFNALAAAKDYPYCMIGQGKIGDARRIMAAVLLNGGLKGDFKL